MLGKEKPLNTPNTKHWHIVILLAVCTVMAVPSGADNAASGIVDSQTFLQRNMTPTGPTASASAAAGDGRVVESRINAARQSDCGRGDAQGGHSMGIFAGARRRTAAAVVALVGDIRRGYLSRDGDGSGHRSRV